MERHKSQLPTDTINKIKGFMKESGITIIEHEVQNTGAFYSVLLQLDKTTLFVNGKGTTVEYATASAYGELMERLLTAILFRFNNIASEDSVHLDKKFIQQDSFDSELAQVLVGSEINWKEALEIQRYFFKSDKSSIIYEEYIRVDSNETVHLPMALVDSMYSSNGMAYGNDINEASVQALSEVFERLVNREIIIKNLKPPILDNWRDYVATDLREKIDEVIEKYNLMVEVRDCSFSGKYPVAGILVVNAEGQYFVKFGAHFTFEVALERCFTELFQGRSMEKSFWKAPIYEDSEEFIQKNLEKVMKDGDGYYPQSFFEDIERTNELVYSFGMNNKEAHANFQKLLNSFGQPIFFKDYSKGNHSVVRFIIPNISNVNIDVFKVKSWYKENIYQTQSIIHFLDLTFDQREQFISFLEKKGVVDSQNLSRFLKLPVSFSDTINYYTFGYLKGIHRVLNKQFDEQTVQYFTHNSAILNNYYLLERNFNLLDTQDRLKDTVTKMLFYPYYENMDLYVSDKAISFSKPIENAYVTFQKFINSLEKQVVH
jgi:ribosomal protein S12 methylthiotransferase accessory factor